MSQNTKCFTFVWKIKNCSFFWIGKEVQSPSFLVQELDQTKWNLYMYFNSNTFKDSIACYMHRGCYDQGPNQYELDYELSFLSADRSALYSEKYLGKKFKRADYDGRALIMKRDEVLMHKSLYIHDDTLTIRCRMWDRQKPISQSGRCFAETNLETELQIYIGIVQKFSCLEVNYKKPIVCIKSPSTKTFFSSMYMSVATDGKLVSEIKPGDIKSIDIYRCKIFIRDVFGNKVKSGQGEFRDKKSHCIPLTISKEHIMENKGVYLPNDELCIECYVILPTDKTIENINEPEYGFDCENITEMGIYKAKLDLYSEENNLENLKTLKDELVLVFKEGILCDTELKTATETFPAHAIVLSARSSVFKSMFTSDMKEKINKCVDIDDLDADTVRRMLLFMYSTSLKDLQYKSAKSLYFAADKYNIISLKQRCSYFLEQNLQISNCCDVLTLADKHQDTSLKIAVQDYIAENDLVILFSDEWKNLEKNQSQLTTEIFRFIYLKNRRS